MVSDNYIQNAFWAIKNLLFKKSNKIQVWFGLLLPPLHMVTRHSTVQYSAVQTIQIVQTVQNSKDYEITSSIASASALSSPVLSFVSNCDLAVCCVDLHWLMQYLDVISSSLLSNGQGKSGQGR